MKCRKKNAYLSGEFVTANINGIIDMKRGYLFGLITLIYLGSCTGSTEGLNGILRNATDIQSATKSFSNGKAKNGEEYFSGVLAQVIQVDVLLREVLHLDEMNAATMVITNSLDSAKTKIKEGKNALNLYRDKDWPKRKELQEVTLEWFNTVNGLIENHMYSLAEPMSRSDSTWTAEELKLYDKYAAAYKNYLEVDARWVAFQAIYAKANDFQTLGTIDEESMINALVQDRN